LVRTPQDAISAESADPTRQELGDSTKRLRQRVSTNRSKPSALTPAQHCRVRLDIRRLLFIQIGGGVHDLVMANLLSPSYL
jgi:hypothetical protein